MLSYKQWKMLNESIMPSFNLGIANPSNLGIQSQSAFTMDIEEAKMAKKKAKKKMFGDDDETGDGEMVEPASDKDDPDVDVEVGDDKGSCGDGDKCGSFSKKKSKKSSKKKCGADMDMDDDDHDDKHSSKEDNDDGGDEDELMFSKKKAKSKMMKSKKKMWSDDDDAGGEGDEDDDDHHDEEEHENDDDDSDEDFGGEDDGDGDDDEEDVAKSKFNLGGKGGDVGGSMGDAGPMFSKKKSKKASKKKMTAEATEDEKWWNSVRNMTASNPDQKYGDGWTEYQTAENLFTPVDTENLTQAVRPGQDGQPGPGEVGFAPQGRIN